MNKTLKTLCLASMFAVSMPVFADNTEHSVEIHGDKEAVSPSVSAPVSKIESSGKTQGMINFSGLVYASSCYIETNSVKRNVELPRVESNLLKKEGQVAGQTKFTLQLTNCPVVADKEGDRKTGVKIYFLNDHHAINQNTGNLVDNSSAANKAKNVEVQLLNASGNKIDLRKSANEQEVEIKQLAASSDPVFDFTAQYYANGTVEPGVVFTTVPFGFDYQ